MNIQNISIVRFNNRNRKIKNFETNRIQKFFKKMHKKIRQLKQFRYCLFVFFEYKYIFVRKIERTSIKFRRTNLYNSK